MKNILRYLLAATGFLMLIAGCATFDAQKVGPAPIEQAQAEIPENQLLDVGILVFKSDKLTPEQAKEEGTSNAVRKAEDHFIAYHLKNTLQQSGHWGAVRVLPAETSDIDLLVKGKILESNGEVLILDVNVTDASGRTWLQKKYLAEATEASYSDTEPGKKDAFQDLYNTVANDMVKFKKQLSAADIEKIHTISKLKFAGDFAPEAFGNYLDHDKNGHLTVKRLPADGDPMMARLLQIRQRQSMYVDALDEYYEGFYNQMWPSYENWRKLNLTERTALKKIKRSALTQQIAGALLIAAAIALNVSNVDNAGAIGAGMIIVGGQVIINGFNVSKEEEIHAAAIQELSESFGNEMQPVVMEFEGQQYKLTGPAREQFKRWRQLLRKIYYTETGFDEPQPPAGKQTAPHP